MGSSSVNILQPSSLCPFTGPKICIFCGADKGLSKLPKYPDLVINGTLFYFYLLLKPGRRLMVQDQRSWVWLPVGLAH